MLIHNKFHILERMTFFKMTKKIFRISLSRSDLILNYYKGTKLPFRNLKKNLQKKKKNQSIMIK